QSMHSELAAENDQPTSVVLRDLLIGVGDDHVTLTALLKGLRARSFGFVMLLVGLIALVPTLSPVAGVLLIWPAVQMILAREDAARPRWISQRRLPTTRLSRFIDRLVPILRWLE